MSMKPTVAPVLGSFSLKWVKPLYARHSVKDPVMVENMRVV